MIDFLASESVFIIGVVMLGGLLAAAAYLPSHLTHTTATTTAATTTAAATTTPAVQPTTPTQQTAAPATPATSAPALLPPPHIRAGESERGDD